MSRSVFGVFGLNPRFKTFGLDGARKYKLIFHNVRPYNTVIGPKRLLFIRTVKTHSLHPTLPY